MIHIHYRATDGEIFGWENTETPMQQPGQSIVTLDLACPPNATTQKVNVAADPLCLIDKTPVEVALANAPTLQDVQAKVARALAASDQYMMPDRPLADAARAAWVTYRQALRDLSKLPTPAAQIAAWPAAPA